MCGILVMSVCCCVVLSSNHVADEEENWLLHSNCQIACPCSVSLSHGVGFQSLNVAYSGHTDLQQS